MPVTIICPNCKKSIIIHAESTTACASCNAQFPEDLIGPVRKQLIEQNFRRPILLTAGIFACAFFGLLLLMFLILAPLGIGTYNVGGEPVTGAEFMRKVGIIWGIQGLLLVATAVGFWRQFAWARPLFVFYGITLLATSLPLLIKSGETASLIFFLVWSVPFLAFCVWYLYFKPNVKAYYRFLESNNSNNSSASPTSTPH